jgi:ribosomal protein L15E
MARKHQLKRTLETRINMENKSKKKLKNLKITNAYYVGK